MGCEIKGDKAKEKEPQATGNAALDQLLADSEQPIDKSEPKLLTRCGGWGDKADAGHPSDAVLGVTKAVENGDGAGLGRALTHAYEESGGNSEKFSEFQKELTTELKEKGIIVKAGDNSLVIHKDGAAEAVEYKLTGDLDSVSGKMKSSLKEQSYDWLTKKDTDTNPEKVSEKLAGGPISDGKILDSAELGNSFDDAYKSGDFAAHNKNMQSSLEHAFKVGGMDAVNKYFKQADEHIDTEGKGVAVIEEDGKPRALNIERLSPDAEKLAPLLSPEQLKEQGIINHPQFGFLRKLEQQPHASNIAASESAALTEKSVADLSLSETSSESEKPIIKSGAELGAELTEAIKSKDFTLVNQEMQAAVVDVLKKGGGIEGVRKLVEEQIDGSTDVKGVGPIVLSNDEGLRVMTIQTLDKAQRSLFAGLSDLELSQQGLVRAPNPKMGIVRIVDNGFYQPFN